MYVSRYYTCEQIDQRLLQGYYDDACEHGFTGTIDEFWTKVLSASTSGSGGSNTNITVDGALDSNSANPVQNSVIAKALEDLKQRFGASLRLNTIENGQDKSYSISLVDTAGRVLSTSEPFTFGGGKVKSISIAGGTHITPDSYGNVDLNIEIPQTVVDQSLDDTSGNPVANSVIARAISGLSNKSVSNITVEDTATGKLLKLLNSSGGVISSVEFTAGGTGTVKKVVVSKGGNQEEISPDTDGTIHLTMPSTETDDSISETSTNPIQNRAVAAELKRIGKNFGVSLQLNEIGSGSDKAYSISLLDSEGNVLSTSDQFTGGGGGNVQTNKIVLTRISGNPTVKLGDTINLTFNYDHVDTTNNVTTGNQGNATITVSHGVNVRTIEKTLVAGSSNTIDVTDLVSVGSNTVRVKVTVGEGTEQQVSQIAWTVNVVQLTLSSSFNIASVIYRGDEVSIPFGLSGSGQKTLRCYIDGVDVEDRNISTSNYNGSVRVSTNNMTHGSHSVQLVAELEQSGGVIKSNSIYFDLAVRELGNTAPIIATRFDYSDGSIINKGSRPYVQSKKYESYTIQYAAYNPLEPTTNVKITEGETVVSSTKVAFVRTSIERKVNVSGNVQCKIQCGTTTYNYTVNVGDSSINIEEPTDNLTLNLSANGRSNSDVNRTEWTYKDITTKLSNFKFGGDGWLNSALRLSNSARAEVNFKPLMRPNNNPTGAFTFIVHFKVSNVSDTTANVISCVDTDGTGFTITAQEAKLVSNGGSEVSTKFAEGEEYTVGFVAYPPANSQSTPKEVENDNMLYLYVNGILSGAVQRGSGDSIYQNDPKNITIGSDTCVLDVYGMRAYSNYLTETQMLELYISDLNTVDEVLAKYKYNDILDDSGNISLDKLPDYLPYVIVTGKQPNGVATLQQAAVNNNKKTKYDVDEILFINKKDKSLSFRIVGGCVSLQGTSSLAYPTKNYRIYTYGANKKPGQLYTGCDDKGIGGVLQESGKYSLRKASKSNKAAAPVKVFCLKADSAESSSSHNTGLARIVNEVLTSVGDLTPPQKHKSKDYQYDVRTTVDGFPCLLFYRATATDTPIFMGKFNFNNDKSTEEVFGFRDIPGYHDAVWVQDKFGGKNPTECWEFLNNDYPMGQFLESDFDAKDTDGKPKWMKVWEARFPDDAAINAEYEAGTKKPKYLERLVKWVHSCKGNPTKFKAEVADYFDVDYLCDYEMVTQIFGCVDQKVKNCMLAFYYDPKTGKVLAYFIFYDNDTILGVRNDGRLKYNWDLDENTIDPELSTPTKTVYAYAGHDSVLWNLVRQTLTNELSKSYKRLRAKITDEYILSILDDEQSSKFCERIYNMDMVHKYIMPKTKGVEVIKSGSVTNQKYSYLEMLQGSRKAHRHWWLTNRTSLFDARYNTGKYSLTDLTFKGNSAAGATIKAIPAKDFYFAFVREAAVLDHRKVSKNTAWSYTYDQMANIGTIFHFYGGEVLKNLDLSSWGGFTDLSLPKMPLLDTLILGKEGSTYTLTELVIGNKLPMLKHLDMRNYTMLSSVDLSGCEQIEEVNATGCTALSTMNLANGAQIKSLHLPANYKTLVLRNLPNLKRSDIVFDNIASISSVWIENCKGIDSIALVRELFNTPNNSLKYVRISNLEAEGDGRELKDFYDARLGGLDSDGNTVSGHCTIGGKYQLTKYMDKSQFDELSSYFNELDLRQPEYTGIYMYMDTPVATNVYNMDNDTGYPATEYKPSGHVAKILNARKKQVVLISNQKAEYPYKDVRMAEIPDQTFEFSLNNTDKSNTLDKDGHVMMYEPGYWYKGVNDYFGKKNYLFVSTNKEKPSVHSSTKVLQPTSTKSGKAVSDSSIISLTSSTGNSVLNVNVSGYKQVRFYVVPETNSCFTDDSGNVMPFNTSGDKFIRGSAGDLTPTGMYIIVNVPAGATQLYVTMSNDDVSKSDAIVGSKSDKIVDMEPEWLRCDERLMSIGPATYIDDNIECKDISIYNSNGRQFSKTFNHDRNYGFDFVENSGFENFSCTIWFHLVRLSILTGNRRLAKPKLLGYTFMYRVVPYDGYFSQIGNDPSYITLGIQGLIKNFYEGFREFINGNNSYRTRTKYVRWGKYCLPLFAGTDYSQQTNTYFGAESGSTPVSKAWISVLGHLYTNTQTIFTYGRAINDNTLYPCINLSRVRSVTRVDYDKF